MLLLAAETAAETKQLRLKRALALFHPAHCPAVPY
jgi:hypothetical protein